MSSRLLQDNPLWLYIGSILIFSLVVLMLLFSRGFLFSKSPKTVPSPTSTPTPKELSIAISSLQNRKYNPVLLTVEQTILGGNNFTSQIISFFVDGLKEYARVDTPTTKKPANGYPVVILDHGYIVSSQYSTISSYEAIESFFASNGYIVVKPDYRGNGNSQGADDPLQRYNYPVDVMTLLASVKNIPQADDGKIYLWGHSMGGEVTLSVLEILGKQPSLSPSVKAAVLWAPVTDPGKWFGSENLKKIPEALLTPFPYTKTFEILGEPSDSSPIWQSINPLNFLSSITVPVQLNHGTADQTVPYRWSQELVGKMQDVQKSIDFISYPGADHNLSPDSSQALQNNLQFFRKY